MTTASPAVFWYLPLKDTFDYKNIHTDTLITNTLSLKKQEQIGWTTIMHSKT